MNPILVHGATGSHDRFIVRSQERFRFTATTRVAETRRRLADRL